MEAKGIAAVILGHLLTGEKINSRELSNKALISQGSSVLGNWLSGISRSAFLLLEFCDLAFECLIYGQTSNCAGYTNWPCGSPFGYCISL